MKGDNDQNSIIVKGDISLIVKGDITENNIVKGNNSQIQKGFIS